jgi:hydrogenase maturation protease
MKTLVVGLGNSLLTDDGVGIYVAHALAARRLPPNVEVVETSLGGLRLLDAMGGYERVVLVDAIQTAGGRPGQLHRLGPNDLCTSRHAGCSHDMTLPVALALGRQLGMVLPADENLAIVAIEVDEVLTFGERCTPEVEAAIPLAVEQVLRILEEPCTSLP